MPAPNEPPDDDRELRHLRARDRHHELGAVAGDAAGLVLLADHEAGDVLQEDERDAPLARELDEVRALLRALGEEDAVVREDPDREALDVRPAADERLAVERLELVEAAAVDDPRDHLARVHVRAVVVGDQAVELVRVERRRLGRRRAPTAARGVRPCVFATMRRAIASACSSLGGVVVGDAGLAGVDVGAAELLGGHVLAGRRLHERRAADEDRAGAAHDHRLVAHRGHVGAAGGARAHHDRDLRDARGRHARLVVEDAAEVVAVREHLVLQRQERAARVDEVDAGQAVLLGDLLRAQVLLHGQREVRAALDRGVVRHDHALLTLDDADAGDDARRSGAWPS